MSDGERIGGYRVLRRLATGGRATVRLAHGGDPAMTAVLKTTAADDPAAVREAAALDRGAGEHVVALLDAVADDDRLTLVLPRLPGGDLSRLLAERMALEGGEAVTILAPLAATVARLHDAGVAHGALSAASVLFDEEHAPVLTGFGAAAVFAAGAPEIERERTPEVAADRAALRSLASTVLARVAGSRRTAAHRLLADVAAASDADLAGMLACRVFDLAAALPVRDADPPTGEPVGGGRIVPVTASVPDAEVRGAGWYAGWVARIERWIDRSPAAEARAALGSRWAALSRGRRRMVLGAGTGAVALVVALVAVPGAGTSSAEPAAATVSPPAAASGSSASASAQAGRTDAPSAAGSPGDAVTRGDDPVAATTALLQRREDCRRQLSVLCLDGVEQDGSAAADADRAAIVGAQAGGELGADRVPPAASAAPRLSERVGDSALVVLAGGASMLLVRDGGAWRLRDLLPAPAAAPTPSTPPPAG